MWFIYNQKSDLSNHQNYQKLLNLKHNHCIFFSPHTEQQIEEEV